MSIRPLLRKGLQFISRHKGVMSFCLLLAFIAIPVLGSVHYVFAADTSTVALQLGDIILATLTWLINYIVIGIGKLILMLIQIIIIPVLNYNSFSSSPIIGLGWSLVRDIMNMFVIVALIAIAIYTIIGDHHHNWEQQLPQLFIAVILMNFSRTICGLLIDVSQVVMFTFVNALLDIAAGNFTQMLSLQDFGKMNEAAVATAVQTGQGFTPFTQFISAFLQIPLYGSIAAILFLLALAFLYRIVLLWVLVILSPMAFFMGGIKGIFHGAEKSAADWWGKFTGALMMGPILTFFLWLALAASSSGSLSSSEGFNQGDTSSDTYFSVQALDSSHVTSLLLALILLTVGMQIAGEQSARVGGFAGQLINEGMGRRVVGGSITAPLRAGRAAAGYAGRTADVYGGRLVGNGKETLRENFGKGVMSLGTAVGSTGGIVGATLGQGIVAAGGAVELQGEHLRAQREQASKAKIGAMSDAQKVNLLKMAQSGKTGLMDANDIQALTLESIGGKAKKEAQHILGDDAADKMLANSYATLQGMAKEGKLDDAQEAKLNAGMSKDIVKLVKHQPEVAKAFMQSDKFDWKKLYNNEAAMNSPEIRAALGNITARTTKEGNVTALQEAERGVLGKKAADVLAGLRPTSSAVSAQKFAELRNSGTADSFKQALETKSIDLSDVKVEDMQGPRAGALARAIATSNVDINALARNESDVNRQAQVTQSFINNIVTEQDSGTIASALRGGKISPNDLSDSMFTGGSPAQQVELVRGVIGAKSNVGMMPGSAQDAFTRAVIDLRNTGVLKPKEATTANAMLLDSGKTLTEVLPNVKLDPQTPTFSASDKSYVTQLIKEDAGNAVHLAPSVMSAAKPNEATRMIVDNTKTSQVAQLAEKFATAEQAERAKIMQKLETIAKAVELHQKAAPKTTYLPNPGDQARRQKIYDLHDQMQDTMSTLRALP